LVSYKRLLLLTSFTMMNNLTLSRRLVQDAGRLLPRSRNYFPQGSYHVALSESYHTFQPPPGARGMASLRRKRVKYEKYNTPQLGNRPLPASGGLEDPFRYSGDSLQEYSEKATLSPWTPVPDPVARKIFDIADPSSEDRHVELGSGDGRVNFFAIEAGIRQSVGIDIDEDIIQVAKDRLNRIHPKPNLEFIVADLMDPHHPAWKYVEEATILTMYFATEGLDKIRPLLETALRGKRCKIFCCGYAMPGWDYQMAETILGMTVHFYDWGNADIEDSNITDVPMINQIPMNNLAMDKFSNKRKATFVPDPLQGFHSDDLVDYGWDDFNPPPENEVAENRTRKGP
jgi:hypothetical protein